MYSSGVNKNREKFLPSLGKRCLHFDYEGGLGKALVVARSPDTGHEGDVGKAG